MLAVVFLTVAPAQAAQPPRAPAQSRPLIASPQSGRVYAWGAGGHGQLGTGALRSKRCSCSPLPRRVSGLSGVSQVGAGFQLSVALRANGTVWAWGSNNQGQLGVGFISKKGCECLRRPAEVVGLHRVVAISVAQSFVLALRENGSVWAWGGNSFGELGIGVNPFGKRGCQCEDRPVRLVGLPASPAISAGSGMEGMALDKTGHVWDWEGNKTGTLGLHITNVENCLCQPAPQEVRSLPLVKAVSAGGGFGVAVDTKGQVWVWGVDDQSQLAKPPITSGVCACIDYPVRVSGLPRIVALDAGSAFTLALDSGGHLWGWERI